MWDASLKILKRKQLPNTGHLLLIVNFTVGETVEICNGNFLLLPSNN